ncbi:hypothetical protein BDB13_6406 [Rhodococcus sp. OK302]|nr:hypothetical protein BDB13_6406 [Rhodococcus sp. OK302]
MVAPRRYPDELRERATRMPIDACKNPATRTGAYKRVADQLGVHPRRCGCESNARRSTRACVRGPRVTTHPASPNSNAKSKSYAERTRSRGRRRLSSHQCHPEGVRWDSLVSSLPRPRLVACPDVRSHRTSDSRSRGLTPERLGVKLYDCSAGDSPIAFFVPCAPTNLTSKMQQRHRFPKPLDIEASRSWTAHTGEGRVHRPPQG